MVNVLQLKINQELLEESRDESKDLTKFVTSLTLFFLPITFVSVSGTSTRIWLDATDSLRYHRVSGE